MNRLDEFALYYRALNEYVILYELLYGANEQAHYLDFVDIHKQLVTERQSWTDEQFVAGLEEAELALREQYVELIDGYFNRSLAHFVVFKNNNSQAQLLYNDIVRCIREEQRLDIHLLTECIQGIEIAIPAFSSRPISTEKV